MVPLTSSFSVGAVLLMPTLPEDIRTFSTPEVPRVNTLELGECIVVPVPRLKVSADNLSVVPI